MTPREPLLALVGVVSALCVAMSFAGITYCYFDDPEVGGLTSLTAWTSDTWTVTTTAEFNAGLPLQVNTTGDEVKLVRATGGAPARVYTLAGGGTTAFWAYDPAANAWSTLASTLASVGAGGALFLDGGDTMYSLAGGTPRRSRCTPSRPTPGSPARTLWRTSTPGAP